MAAAVIVLLVIVIIGLFVLGGLSAAASAKSQDQHDPNTGAFNTSGLKQCHDYTMWIAIGTFLAAVLILVVIILYAVSQNRTVQEGVKNAAQNAYLRAGQYFGQPVPAPSPMGYNVEL